METEEEKERDKRKEGKRERGGRERQRGGARGGGQGAKPLWSFPSLSVEGWSVNRAETTLPYSFPAFTAPKAISLP